MKKSKEKNMAKFRIIMEIDIEDESQLSDLLFDYIPVMEEDYSCIIKVGQLIDEPEEKSK
jgi:hypothetical protein